MGTPLYTIQSTRQEGGQYILSQKLHPLRQATWTVNRVFYFNQKSNYYKADKGAYKFQ